MQKNHKHIMEKLEKKLQMIHSFLNQMSQDGEMIFSKSFGFDKGFEDISALTAKDTQQ